MKASLYLLLLLLQCYPIIAFTQDKPLSPVDQKVALCEKTMAELSGKPGEIEKLIATGTEGLREAGATPKAKFVFFQSIGVGYYYKQNFEESRQNFQQAYQVAIAAGMVEQSLKPLGNLIHINHYLGKQEEADLAARLLQNIVESTDTLKGKSDAYYNLGLYFQQQKVYYTTALNYFLKSAALHKPIADTTQNLKRKLDYATKLMMVAEIYIYLKQPEKALEYLEKIKPYLNRSIIVDITAYGKFIRSYALENDKQAALKYYNLLSETAEKNPGKWSELVSSSLKMAELSLSEQNYDEAKRYIDKADKQSKLDNKEILTSSVNQSYGDYWKSMQNFGEAIKYYKKAEGGAKQYNKEQYRELLRSLTGVLMSAGNAEEARKYYDKYISLNDSLTQQKLDLNLAEMEAIFQNKEKQQQINAQQKDLGFARKQRLWLIVALALACIIALMLVIFYRNKKKTADALDDKNKKLAQLNDDLEEANRTKAKLFGIIGHDLRTPVKQMYLFLKLQKLNVHNEQEKAERANKMETATESLLEMMEDLLLWSKTQMSELKPNIKPVDLLSALQPVEQLLQLQLEEKNIRLSNSIARGTTVMADYNFLQTIYRNLLQNSVKASPAGKAIVIYTSVQNGNTILSIQNSGSTFTQEDFEKQVQAGRTTQTLNGLGSQMIQEFSGKMNAVLRFSSQAGTGTIAEIIFAP